MVQRAKIPARLPQASYAMNLIGTWLDAPQERLEGLTPRELLRTGDILQTWFVGSCVWMPAVMGEPSSLGSDIDIALGYKGHADLAGDIVRTLNERAPLQPQVPLFTVGKQRNAHNGSKIFRGETPIIDIWEIPHGASIAEALCSFKHDHERVALAAGATSGEVTALTRIVRPLDYYKDTLSGQREKKDIRNKLARGRRRAQAAQAERVSVDNGYYDGS